MGPEISKHTEIANEVLLILKAPEQHGRTMRLSLLGGRLKQKFSPWRDVLAGRTLRNILEAELRDQVVFDGIGGQATVGLSPDSDISENSRFDKTIWAAFAKPIPSGQRRILYANKRPFKFNDEPGDVPLTIGADGFEVEHHLVPPEGLARPSRDRAIMESIKRWCSLHELDASGLLEMHGPEQAPRERPAAAVAPHGLVALEQLIKSIPPEEWKNFSLPLDLLHRLISSK